MFRGPLGTVTSTVALQLLSVQVQATNLEQCLDDIRSGLWGTVGGTDNHGNPLSNISQANAITYELCVRACGSGPESFDWPTFYQQFSSWLLPYFALLSQLPFGAESRLSNLMSVFLTVGSPALAAYSLALTALNGRWVTRRFRGISYPNAERAASVLRNLQTAPIKLSIDDGLLPSLVVLHDNDDWWKELADGLKHNSPWSIAAVTSMGWVVIAYLLTIIDSFTGTGTDPVPGTPFRALGILNLFGKGVGFVWLWLLPITYGWVVVAPMSDPGRLRRLFKRIDPLAHVATSGIFTERVKPAAAESDYRGLTVECHPSHEYDGTNLALEDAGLCAPIYNYARVFTWSAAVEDVSDLFRVAASRARRRQPVNVDAEWESSTSGIHPKNRSGALESIMAYCSRPQAEQARARHMIGVYERMFVAAFFAMSLQWGTTGAAMVVVYFAPTVGLGCESGSFLLYGVIATVVWILMVSSSILAHHANPDAHRTDRWDKIPTSESRHLASTLAVVCRRLGKILAAFNAIWLVFANIAQFSNFYDRCWCNSCVLSLRSRAYNVIQATAEDVDSLKTGWVAGVALGTGCAVVFILFIHILLDSAD